MISQEQPEIQPLIAAKQVSVAQLLFQSARLWNQQAIGRMQQRFPAVRMAHTSLLPHIDWEGTRMTELATRMGISKQAVSQLVQDMVRLDLLEVRPDPADGRARKVYFSLQGQQALLEGLNVLVVMQQELAKQLGVEDMQQLLLLLQRLVPALEQLEDQGAWADPFE